MKKILILFLSLFLLVISCKKEEHPMAECTQLQTLEEIKSYLSNSQQENNLLISHEIRSDLYELSFEDGSIICFPRDLIETIESSEEAWTTQIEYSDGTNFSLDYLGSVLNITHSNLSIDPFGNTPLCAKLDLNTPVKGKIQVRVIGRDGADSDIIYCTDELKENHTVPILGLYPDFNNQVEISFVNEHCEERFKTMLNIQTESLPDGFPEVGIVKSYDVVRSNELVMLNYRTPHRLIMVDVFGKIRWFGDWFVNNKKRGIIRLHNGNLAFGIDETGIIYEYTMLGEQVKEWAVQPPFERVHHDLIELPDGNFVVTVNKSGSSTELDYLIEMDRETGNTLNIWNLNEILPKRYTYYYSPSDWLHVNSVSYDPSDHSLVVSGRHQGIFKVNWNNELQWILATPEGWEGHEPYLLTPQTGSEPLEWTWGQHSAMVMPDGNIFVFDNGFGRAYGAAEENYSRAVEYEILPEGIGGSVKQVWSYGKERKEELFSPIIGDVDYLPETETRFIVSGALGIGHSYSSPSDHSIFNTNDNPKVRILEVDQNKNILFEMTLSSPSQSSSVYRAEKMSIHPPD